MAHPTSPAERPEIAATVDAALLDAIDARIREQPGLDRDAVIDEALRLWLAHEQREAMKAQFALTPEDVDPDEWESWRAIQSAAAEHWIARGSEE